MKKVLQINSVVNTGSTGRIAEDIGLLLMDNNWESIIAFGRYGNSSKSKLIKIGNKLDNYVHVAYTRIFDRHGLASRNATLKFVDDIEKLNPDIIHFHNLHGYYLNIEVLFTYIAKKSIPTVWTLHDCWPFTGHCSYFTAVECHKWKKECNHCPQKKGYPSSYLFDRSKKNYYSKRRFFNLPDRMILVPVSNWLNDLIGESFLSGYPTQVINNGIDIENFSIKNDNQYQEKLNLKDQFIILGVANPWSERKGLSDFIELSQHIKHDEKILLIGLNDSQINTLPSNIIGIKKTENISELADIYSMANVFVNPTYEDNFPTTNLEALACGTPIITYNTGGSPEAVSENTGFVVEQGNISKLVQAIKIIKDKGKSFYTRACRERAVEKYNKIERYSEYLELYQSLIQ